MEEMFRFLESLLSDGTQFIVRRVYQYDTFPGYTLLGYDDRDEDGLRFDEPWMKLFEDQILKFKEQIEKGGFILAHWDGTTETEERIKEETKATIRCIPLEADEESLQPGKCVYSGKPSSRRVLFARAY
jgi:hypothetical protein